MALQCGTKITLFEIQIGVIEGTHACIWRNHAVQQTTEFEVICRDYYITFLHLYFLVSFEYPLFCLYRYVKQYYR